MRCCILCNFAFISQVIRNANLAFSSSGKCLTMEALQSAVVESLSIAANPATAGIRGDATLQYCAGKGDWKFKKDWLSEKKDYSHSCFCRRCNCGPGPAEHWLVFLHLSFDKPEMVSDMLHANVPEDLPILGKKSHTLCFDYRLT